MTLTAPPVSRREAILIAALDVFTDSGYERASVEEICRTTPASVGSFYHHFGCKEGVATALYEEAILRYQKQLMGVLERPLEPESMVIALVYGHMEWVRDNEKWAKYLLRMGSAPATASARQSVLRHNRVLLDAVASWAQPHVDSGAIAKVAPGSLLALMLGPSYFVTRSWLAGEIELTDIFIQSFAEAAWRSVNAGGP